MEKRWRWEEERNGEIGKKNVETGEKVEIGVLFLACVNVIIGRLRIVGEQCVEVGGIDGCIVVLEA